MCRPLKLIFGGFIIMLCSKNYRSNTFRYKFIPIYILAYLIVCLFYQSHMMYLSAQEGKDWLGTPSEWNGRVVIWNLNSEKFAIEQLFTMEIHEQQSEKYSLSFVHSGYTEDDPDGKSGLLTVSLAMRNKPLTEDEREQLKKQGFILSDKLKITPPNVWYINVNLPESPDEELRIRKVLNLPREISSVGSIQPFQISWKNIEGDKLYKWLTDENSGLRFVLTSEAVANLMIGRKTTIDFNKLSQWWDKFVGNLSFLLFKGDAGIIITSIISYGCVVYDDNSGKKLDIKDAIQEAKIISERLEAIAKLGEEGKKSISRDALFGMNWSVESSYAFNAPVKLHAQVLPGIILDKNPNLVKDLSDDGIGLGAINGH